MAMFSSISPMHARTATLRTIGRPKILGGGGVWSPPWDNAQVLQLNALWAPGVPGAAPESTAADGGLALPARGLSMGRKDVAGPHHLVLPTQNFGVEM
jgi:hypothetical protein